MSNSESTAPSQDTRTPLGLPQWALFLFPVVLVVLVLVGLFVAGPGFERGAPAPDLTVSYHTIPDSETTILHVTNNGPEPVTVAQVFVDEAYWDFGVEKTNSLPFVGTGDGPKTLAPGEGAKITLPYPFTLHPGNEVEVELLLAGGETFAYEIKGVQTTPRGGTELFGTLGLIGLFVGVIPVTIGMLWLPAIRATSDRWMYAILAFAAGVLGYLAVESTFEAFELTERIPGTYAGPSLIVLAIVGTLLAVQSVSEWRKARTGGEQAGLRVAYLVAFGIGLHNLAEGLAIGGAYALGEMSLAVFFVAGFMLHNVTEGPAIVAPLARGQDVTDRPRFRHFAALGLLGGAPVILGGWIGGLALSPTVNAFFLAMGAGAILQVLWELIQFVRVGGGRVASVLNLWAFLAGAIVMYATGLFVAL